MPSEEFWVFIKMQIFDNRKRDVFRFQHFNLAFHLRSVDRQIAHKPLLLEHPHLLRINQQLRLSGEAWSRRNDVNDAKNNREKRHEGDDGKLPTEKACEKLQGLRA